MWSICNQVARVYGFAHWSTCEIRHVYISLKEIRLDEMVLEKWANTRHMKILQVIKKKKKTLQM